ncbi:sulfurtransferase [Neobacillus sp. LXY-4]|uniref:sulfurtransferase n=1 Tax=Neobacillus sp. LXY-4 TaxID=3379826 RepID=UPI003EE3E630
MRAIVDNEWLKQHLSDPKVRVVDCRFYLGKPDEGKKEYLADHISGAVYLHLEHDLSAPVTDHGGRHPLPDINELKGKLEQAGIDSDTTVIAYDQGDGAFAARLYWLLNYLGHGKVAVLNGGYAAWKEAGYPVDNEIPSYPAASFDVQINQDIIASFQDVKQVVSDNNGEIVLIDSRDPKRFQGIEEPIDKKAGHIPGAVNKNWVEGLEKGFYKTASEQEKRFEEYSKQQPLIVYCGSGVTATPNFIALKEAGYENVRLYVGSFSDWISYDENEVHTGK